ncbi:hypothetical protein KI387_027733, partial [Taxus chinensis]
MATSRSPSAYGTVGTSGRVGHEKVRKLAEPGGKNRVKFSFETVWDAVGTKVWTPDVNRPKISNGIISDIYAKWDVEGRVGRRIAEPSRKPIRSRHVSPTSGTIGTWKTPFQAVRLKHEICHPQ